MKLSCILAAILSLSACSKEPLSTEATENSNFPLEKLFTHEGCTIYRFHDGGYSRYFTDCRGGVEYKESRNCGKNCNHTESFQNQTVE